MSRVMIVEPLPLLRLAIGQAVQRLGYQVVAQVGNSQEALLHARSDAPQLVVLELTISGLGGLDLIRRLKLRDPTLQFLVYTGQNSNPFARLCMQAGVDGFVSKHDDPSELDRALHAVVHGRRYFPKERATASTTLGGTELDSLSARELTVLELISEGCSNQSIAEQLSISYKTVSTYKTRLQEKLQVDSRLALAGIAQRNGIGPLGVGAVDALDAQAQPDAEPLQQALLQAVLEASPNPMFVRDRVGRLLLCNRPYLEMHHTSFDRVQGQRLLDAYSLSVEQGRKAQARYEAVVEKGETYTLQTSLEILGEPHSLQVWAQPWRDAHGAVLGMVGFVEDMTDRNILLGQLRDAHEQAQARYRQLTRFASVVLGDLTEPVQRLQSSLGAAKLPTAGRSALQRLTQCLAQLEQLISLEQVRPSWVPGQLDIVEWVAGRLAAFNAHLPKGGVAPMLEMSGVAVRQLWIDEQRFAALFDTLLQYLSETAPKAPLRISLATRLQSNGFVNLNLAITLSQPLEHRQGLALQLCQNLAQSMDGSFRSVHESGETTFLIEVEFPAALPG
ncbi:LuxR C-terminal-related transcriptional regulator [Pseudomonas sp. H9]|uniref:LuxR C-terminal-related transcriptional regulator n=1 Tax=Pseudomonas sp. H9 TaxID=483968 RepID=UPI0010576E88|nr:LuxR C-terminal-related transcriptional regulator [Pseudomonas sp. H9]TDF84346.1 response regulator [Pseudomonas sp. H9]